MGKYQEIKAPNGTAWIRVVEGTVYNQQSTSETDIYVSSIGGIPRTVHDTIHKNQFWIRDTDGTEKHFEFVNTRFPVADGHTVRICWGAGKEKTGPFLYGYNYNTKEAFDFMDGRWRFWAQQSGLLAYPLLYRVPLRWIPTIFFVTLAFMAPNLIAIPPNVAAQVEQIMQRKEAKEERYDPRVTFKSLLGRPAKRFLLAFTTNDAVTIVPKLLNPVRAMRLWGADADSSVPEAEADRGPAPDKNRIYLPSEIEARDALSAVTLTKAKKSAMISLAFYSLLAWGFVIMILQLLGYFFFGIWWRKFSSKKLRERVIAVFNAPM